MKNELDALFEGDGLDEEVAAAENEVETEAEETEETESEDEALGLDSDDEETEEDDAEEDAEEEGSTAEPEASGKDSSETEEPWTKAAYLDEKSKRQERERELEELKAELNQYQQAGQQEDIDYSDPKAVAAVIQQRAETLSNQKFVNLSRAFAKTQHSDYEEMETVFANAAKKDPNLVSQMLAAESPAEFAYQTGKKLKFMAEVDDPDKYKESLREQIKQELLAELKTEPEATEKPKPKRKPSLAKTPSVSGAAPKGDSLEDILGR